MTLTSNRTQRAAVALVGVCENSMSPTLQSARSAPRSTRIGGRCARRAPRNAGVASRCARGAPRSTRIGGRRVRRGPRNTGIAGRCARGIPGRCARRTIWGLVGFRPGRSASAARIGAWRVSVRVGVGGLTRICGRTWQRGDARTASHRRSEKVENGLARVEIARSHVRAIDHAIHSGKREPGDLPFLSDTRIHGLLGERKLSGLCHRCHRRLRRPDFPAPTIAVWEESHTRRTPCRPTRRAWRGKEDKRAGMRHPSDRSLLGQLEAIVGPDQRLHMAQSRYFACPRAFQM